MFSWFRKCIFWGREDIISLNPCLQDILVHLPPSDILRCRLVSRRFRDVISQNANHLPKTDICIEIDASKDPMLANSRDAALIVVTVTKYGSKSSVSFRITRYRLRMLKFGLPYVSDYYKNNGTPMDETNDIPDARLLKPIAGESTDDTMDFRCNQLLEGLRTLLTFLDSRFSFASLCVNQIEKNILPADCLKCVMDVVKAKQPACQVRDVKGAWPQLIADVTNYLGSVRLEVAPESKLSDFYQLVPAVKWNEELEFILSTQEFNATWPVANILRQWTSGLIRLKRVVISQRYEGEKFSYTLRDIITALQPLQCFSVKPDEEEKNVEILVGRTIDNEVIRVYYSIKEQKLEMHHFVNNADD